jgi:hypothetical protein
MKRLLLRLLPELKRFRTEEERWEVCEQASEQAGGDRHGFAAFLLAVMIGFIPQWSPYVLPQLTIQSWIERVGNVWFGIAGVTIAGLIYTPRGIASMRQSLWKQLADKGIPCCIHCGYDLTGNESGKCPECGKPIGEPRQESSASPGPDKLKADR